MSATIQVTISDKAKQLINKLSDKDGLNAEVARAIDRQNELSINLIMSKYLSGQGPKPLPPAMHILRTGKSPRLRTSLLRGAATVDGDNVSGSVISSGVKYAGVHEFGFRGTVSVKEHTRKLKYAALKTGEKITMREAIKRGLTTKKGDVRKKAGTLVKQPSKVRAHSMNMNMPERAPIRTGIRDRLKEYADDISSTIVNFLSATN